MPSHLGDGFSHPLTPSQSGREERAPRSPHELVSLDSKCKHKRFWGYLVIASHGSPIRSILRQAQDRQAQDENPLSEQSRSPKKQRVDRLPVTTEQAVTRPNERQTGSHWLSLFARVCSAELAMCRVPIGPGRPAPDVKGVRRKVKMHPGNPTAPGARRPATTPPPQTQPHRPKTRGQHK